MKWFRFPTTQCLLAAVLLTLAGCKANYPNCKGDSDCPGNAQGKEWCVNGMCQQCRPALAGANDCGAGRKCNGGRCEALPGYCTQNRDCPSGLCEKNRCVACQADTQRPGGTRCSAGKCEADSRKICKSSDDCAETEDCVNGRCTPTGRNRYAAEGGCQLETIYFGYNEFDLNPQTTAQVDKNADCIKQKKRSVNLVGHTDPRGTPEYNLALSDKRSQAVKRRLSALGIGDDKAIPVPRGELDANGTDESSWDRDRRVEFNWR
jgi:peptidoglycan-associated lipoprotein